MKIGIVGATGAVGKELIKLFNETNKYKFELACFASNASVGKTLKVKSFTAKLQYFSIENTKTCDIIFLCVSGEFSLKYGKILSLNSYVIDNSSAFRYENDVPLIVPPVNWNSYNHEKLIANPNCSSAIALVVLNPIHKKYKIEHMIVSTYQAASGAGLNGLKELKQSIKKFKTYENNPSIYFKYNLAFNVIPQVDEFQNNKYTKEEMKIVWEVQKVLDTKDIKISVTAVRVPVLRSHAESITLKLSEPIKDLNDIYTLLNKSKGVLVKDDLEKNIYPMPSSSSYKKNIEVGRIRYNLIYDKYGLDLFISGDQLLRGAALNAYEIFEHIINKYNE